MDERLKQILDKVKDWWNKFDRKQKGILLSAFSVVLIMVLILVLVLGHDTYEELNTYEDTYTSSQVVSLLKENNITYRTSADGKKVEVLTEDMAEASLILGANQIETKGYGIENVVSSDFTTTEADKQRKYQKYKEDKLAQDLMKIDTITSASVTFNIPEQNGTLISNDKESFATIYLETTDGFKDSTAEAIAKMAAFLLGNESTDQISIMKTDGTLIFPKIKPAEDEEEEDTLLDVTNQLVFTSQLEDIVKKEVQEVVLGTGQFDNVSVTTRLVVDFDKVKKTSHDYTPAEGQEQGVLSHEDYYEGQNSVNESGAAVPGTSSNGENGTTYVTGDTGNNSNSYEKQWSKDYLPNESVTERTNALGSIVKDKSTVSLSAYSYRVYREEEIATKGLLEDQTWEEFKVANQDRVKLTVDSDLTTLVANAAGVPVENVAIMAYEEPIFYDKVEVSAVSTNDIIVIALVVLIILLLGFVVWKTFAGEKKKKEVLQEEEEELSVEALLQSEPEELQDIEMEQKSETRIMIEKFVDDNPEAVALLLRNWLEEEWGM